jgi:hypothetical protein
MGSERHTSSVDDLILYRRDGDPVVHKAVASGYTYTDLHQSGLLPDSTFKLLEEVAGVIETNGRICETRDLLDAWLDSFEILASVQPPDIPAARSTADVRAVPRSTPGGST